MSVCTGDAESTKDILYLNYNQTSTALSVGTKTGYMIYDLDQVHECRPTYESRGISDVCIIERNYCSSLIAFVSLHSPRKLVLYNYTKGAEIADKHFPNTVLSVKLNRKNVVVCLEDTICIYCLTELKDHSAHRITNVPANVKGLIAMTHGNGNSIIAYPVNLVTGDVQIFDATEKHAKSTIPAHTSQLAALAFDENGEKLATASIKGTVIRVFSVADREILFEFRRGVKRYVEIHSLSFDKDAEFLCASSNTETVHIFKLCVAEPVEPIDEDGEGWMEMFGRVLTQSAKYLPTQMSDVFTQQRSFATVHLPFVDQRTMCSISKIQNVLYIMVASLEGFLYIYELNTEIGGSCRLVKQHRLEGPFEPYLEPVSKFSSPASLRTATSRSIKTSDLNPHIQSTNTDTVPDKSEAETSISVHSSNGIPTNDELPPLLNKVE